MSIKVVTSEDGKTAARIAEISDQERDQCRLNELILADMLDNNANLKKQGLSSKDFKIEFMPLEVYNQANIDIEEAHGGAWLGDIANRNGDGGDHGKILDEYFESETYAKKRVV